MIQIVCRSCACSVAVLCWYNSHHFWPNTNTLKCIPRLYAATMHRLHSTQYNILAVSHCTDYDKHKYPPTDILHFLSNGLAFHYEVYRFINAYSYLHTQNHHASHHSQHYYFQHAHSYHQVRQPPNGTPHSRNSLFCPPISLTHNRFTALLELVRDHPGEQVPER